MVLKFFESSFRRVKSALSRTRDTFGKKLRTLFQTKIDTETIEQLEQLFYEADLGIESALQLTETVKDAYKKNPAAQPDELVEVVQTKIVQLLKTPESPPPPQKSTPYVLLVVGVNGSGKTTCVAKLAKRFSDQGQSVLVAAADTFRAAAVEQLTLWSKRIPCELVTGSTHADPAAVTFDALQAAQSRNLDVVIVDTAGRVHTRDDLMKELQKIHRVCDKVIPNAPHETLLVLDATTGQSAIDQAKIFHTHTPVDGLCLTKLDGTAKGGIVVQIHCQLGIPVTYIGTGEGLDDLDPFDPEEFAKALF